MDGMSGGWGRKIAISIHEAVCGLSVCYHEMRETTANMYLQVGQFSSEEVWEAGLNGDTIKQAI